MLFMDFKQFIATRIYELRSTKNISGRKLAKDLGYSDTFITQIENGKKLPSLDTIEKICNHFKISYRDFFIPFFLDIPDEGDPKVRKNLLDLLNESKTLSKEELEILLQLIKLIKKNR